MTDSLEAAERLAISRARETANDMLEW